MIYVSYTRQAKKIDPYEKKTKVPLQQTVEVIEHLEEEQIDLEVVHWFAGEGENRVVPARA